MGDAGGGGEPPGATRKATVATGVVALLLFAATLAAYRLVTAPEGYNGSDPRLIVPTSLSLLRDGDLDLTEFEAAADPSFHGLLLIDGRPYNRYPVGTSLLILPIVWLADRGPAESQTRMEYALRLAALAAKVLAASSVALLFLVLVALGAGTAQALLLSVVFGFATPHLPIHAGGLFTHNAVIPLVLVSVLLLAGDGRRAWAAAAPLAFAFATRPTCLPALLLLSLFVLRHRRAAARRFLLLGSILAVAFVAWSLAFYGEPLPPYYLGYDHTSPYRMSPARFVEGLAGHLVSPNRGLLVFAPVLGFAGWGVARVWRSRAPQAPLYRTLALVVLTHWVMVSLLARKWWGGWSYGPRHVVEVTPLLVVLLVPALDAFRQASFRVRYGLGAAGAAALAWSAFLALHGATSPGPQRWNSDPVNVDEHPERVWDLRDLQALRGVGPRR